MFFRLFQMAVLIMMITNTVNAQSNFVNICKDYRLLADILEISHVHGKEMATQAFDVYEEKDECWRDSDVEISDDEFETFHPLVTQGSVSHGYVLRNDGDQVVFVLHTSIQLEYGEPL